MFVIIIKTQVLFKKKKKKTKSILHFIYEDLNILLLG